MTTAAARLRVPHGHQPVETGDQPVLVQPVRPQLAQDAVQRFHRAADRVQHRLTAGAQGVGFDYATLTDADTLTRAMKNAGTAVFRPGPTCRGCRRRMP